MADLLVAALVIVWIVVICAIVAVLGLAVIGVMALRADVNLVPPPRVQHVASDPQQRKER